MAVAFLVIVVLACLKFGFEILGSSKFLRASLSTGISIVVIVPLVFGIAHYIGLLKQRKKDGGDNTGT